jgi:hypothetical protein
MLGDGVGQGRPSNCKYQECADQASNRARPLVGSIPPEVLAEICSEEGSEAAQGREQDQEISWPSPERGVSAERPDSGSDQDGRRKYVDTPYYIVPRDDAGEEAFAVIREAMHERRVAGMGRVVLQTRERPIIVSAMDDGLLGITLRYAHEVRDAAEFFRAIPHMELPADMVDMAALLIDKKTDSFDPAYLEDRYRTVLVERLREKAGLRPDKRQPANQGARSQNVIDLMAALKRSVAKEKIGPNSGKVSSGATANSASRRSAAAKKTSPTKRSRDRGR